MLNRALRGAWRWRDVPAGRSREAGSQMRPGCEEHDAQGERDLHEREAVRVAAQLDVDACSGDRRRRAQRRAAPAAPGRSGGPPADGRCREGGQDEAARRAASRGQEQGGAPAPAGRVAVLLQPLAHVGSTSSGERAATAWPTTSSGTTSSATPARAATGDAWAGDLGQRTGGEQEQALHRHEQRARDPEGTSAQVRRDRLHEGGVGHQLQGVAHARRASTGR